MKFKSKAHQAAVMAKARKLQQNGFTAYSLPLKRKVKVSPSDKIEIKKYALKNGNHSIMVRGHLPSGDVSRIVGQV